MDKSPDPFTIAFILGKEETLNRLEKAIKRLTKDNKIIYNKKMRNFKNKKGGFLQIIVLIVILFLIMKCFGLTITGIFEWLKTLFLSIW